MSRSIADSPDSLMEGLGRAARVMQGFRAEARVGLRPLPVSVLSVGRRKLEAVELAAVGHAHHAPAEERRPIGAVIAVRHAKGSRGAPTGTKKP